MIFTSLNFLIFFITVTLIYFLLNKKLKIYWLLLSSYYFYMSWNPKYALLMLFSTFITYLSGILIDKSNNKTHKKIFVALSFIINLSILFLFKYYSFMIDTLNNIFNIIGISNLPSTLNLLLPVGISFYTFQALSYTIDIYRNDVKVEKNFFIYALFVSFFPQLVAGPIEKSKNLLKQFDYKHHFSYENLNQGLILMGIGFFYKLVIADRAAILVNQIYNNLGNYQNGGGIYLILATVLFAFQIYFDFNAYSTIARGAAKIMDYDLTINFNVPYIATNVKDFWHRWHISLSTWFKEYLYFPLGGNKFSFIRTQLNLMIVFLVSGLWHGAAWTFVIWGALHGFYQIIENLIGKIVKINNKNFVIKIIRVIFTFILVDFAWIFFRANSVSDAFFIVKHLFDFGMKFNLNQTGLNLLEMIILIINILLVYVLEIINIKHNLFNFLKRRNIVLRWLFYYILIFSILIIGIYGPSYDAKEFIYFQF